MCVWCKGKKTNSETWARSTEETLRKQKLNRERRFLEKRKNGLRTPTGRVEGCENTQGRGEVWELNMDGKRRYQEQEKEPVFTFGAWLVTWHWNSSCFREKLSATENLPWSKLPWLFAAGRKRKLNKLEAQNGLWRHICFSKKCGHFSWPALFSDSKLKQALLPF